LVKLTQTFEHDVSEPSLQVCTQLVPLHEADPTTLPAPSFGGTQLQNAPVSRVQFNAPGGQTVLMQLPQLLTIVHLK
jgi:hypothetical protein